MSRLLGLAVSMVVLLMACDEQPCDNYVDYMCACHDDEPGFNCDDLRDIYEDASPEVQDSCAIELDDQKADDQENGDSCEV